MSDQLPPPPAPGTGGWSPVGPYATSTAAVPPMRSLRGLVIALLVIFVIVALVDVVGAASLFNRAGLIDDLRTSDPPSFSELDDADSSVAGALGIRLFLAIVLLVVFIIWQWRHAKNAETMGARGGLGPGWAIGGWFPVLHFVIPGVQIFQSSKASDREARVHGRRGRGAGIVIAWAITFGLAMVLGFASGNVGETDDQGNLVFDSIDDIETAADSDRLGGVAALVMVPAAALGAIMVWTLSKRQADAYAAMAAATPTAASPPPPSAAYQPQASWGGGPTADWAPPSDQPAPPPAPTVVPPAPSTSGPEGWGTAPGAGSPAPSAASPPAPASAGATPPPGAAPPATSGSAVPPPPGAPAAPVGSAAPPAVPPPPAPPPSPDAGAPAAPPPPAPAPGQDPAAPSSEPLDPASSVGEDSPDASGPEDAPPDRGASDDQPGWAAPSAPGRETPPPPTPPS